MQTSDLNVNNTESDHANAIFRQFQDAIFSREHTYVKTLTKIIFDLLQWQEIATLSLPKKAAIAPFISTTFPRHFCLRANDIARNRSRVIFSRACADIFRRWISSGAFILCACARAVKSRSGGQGQFFVLIRLIYACYLRTHGSSSKCYSIQQNFNLHPRHVK